MASPNEVAVDVFTEVLSEEADWFTFSVFLGVPSTELKDIARNYRLEGTMRCLIEIYEWYTEMNEEPLSWETIVTALRRKKNHHLANKIHSKFIKPVNDPPRPSSSSNQPNEPHPPSSNDNGGKVEPQGLHLSIKEETVDIVSREFQSLYMKYDSLMSTIKRTLKEKDVDLTDIQDIARRQCGLSSLSSDEATFDKVFNRIEKHSSIVNFSVLVSLVENLLRHEQPLRRQLTKFKKVVERFKSSVNMVRLVSMVKAHYPNPTPTPEGDLENVTIVKIKVREFWNEFTVKQFEIIINEIFHTLYDFMSHVSVSKGCICFSWTIPEAVDTAMLLPALRPLELVECLGIISLCIGNKVIYNIEGEGCELIEAAMLQAIELKNTRAVELLLAVGCNSEVATYNGDNAVTNIVNIKQPLDETSSSSNASVQQYVCILGHNEHVETIIHPDSMTASTEQCDACAVKDKIIKHLHMQNEGLHSQLRPTTRLPPLEQKQLQPADLDTETVVTRLKKEIEELRRRNDELLKILQSNVLMDDQVFTLYGKPVYLKNSGSKQATHEGGMLPALSVTLPRMVLSVNAEMRISVSMTSDYDSVYSRVTAALSCNKELCPVINHHNGMWSISIIPQHIGRPELSISIGDSIVRTSIAVIPQHDYSTLELPSNNSFTEIAKPRYLAIANNGNIFVTCFGDHTVHVFDSRGSLKSLFGISDSSLLKAFPNGIEISGSRVLIVNNFNSKVHVLTTNGEMLGELGDEGSACQEQFNKPNDVKVGPDGKTYVADTNNHCVHVFKSMELDSVSHVINASSGNIVMQGSAAGLGRPMCIAFDLFGDVHIAWYYCSSITVFDSNGRYIRQYGDHTNIINPTGIAIDTSGYSFVSDNASHSVHVFDPKGAWVRSLSGFNDPCGIAVSPVDGSLWIADTHNNRLVKYY